MTFECCGNDRKNFHQRLTELPELSPNLTALIVPYNRIQSIPRSRLPSSLSIVSLRGCELARLEFLEDLPNLIALDVSGNHLDLQGGMDLAQYLANPTCAQKLQKLHFSGCHIPLSAMIHIVRAVGDLPRLRDVDMSRNVAVVNATDGDLVASETTELAYHLEQCFLASNSLTVANLSFMSLGDSGVAGVLTGLFRNSASTVTNLNLAGNAATWQSACLLGKLLRASDRNPTLEILNLSANRLGQNGTSAAVDELAVALKDRKHCGLKFLDLSRNRLTGDVLVTVIVAAAQSSLKQLNIFENKWSHAVARRLVNIVDKCPVRLDIALQTVDDTVFVVRN